MYRFEQIRSLVRDGKSNAEISRMVSVDRRTVAKYRQNNTPPKYRKRQTSTREDPFLKFEPLVRKWLERTPRLSGLEIFDFLKDEGYTGSLRTVQTRLRSIRSEHPKERFYEQSYSPGEQSQFDFKEKVEVMFSGGPKIIHFHYGTLPFSSAFRIRAYPNRAFESFIDGIHCFFESIGGMPRSIRIDNLAPCVRKVNSGNSRLYTESFSRAIRYYGFNVLPCRPGTGSDKGDVERDIRTHTRRIQNLISHHGLIFNDFDHLNDWLEEYCQTRQPDASKFLEEQKSLGVLAHYDESVCCRQEFVRVGAHGMVSSPKAASYSVPDRYIGEKVLIVTTPFKVKIFSQTSPRQLICEYDRAGDHQSILKLEHVLPSLVRKPGAMLRWAHREWLFPDQRFKNYFKYLQSLDEASSDRIYLRSINLIQHTSLEEIGTGMELIAGGNSKDPFVDLKNLLLSGHTPKLSTDDHKQEPLAPDLGQYDDLLPNSRKEVS